MGKRSPIRGYNHNIRYRGLVFHVQTEDSGVDNPHVFTHVFYGGVILNTRKLTYDGESAEDVVKALMQAQHKSLLKALKHGELDEKIDSYLGDNPELEPAKPRSGVLSPETPPVEPYAPPANPEKSISAAFDAIRDDLPPAQAGPGDGVPQQVDAATTDVYSKPESDRISVTAPTMLQRDLPAAAQAPPKAPTPPPTPSPTPPPIPTARTGPPPNTARQQSRPPPAPRPPTPNPVKPAARVRSGSHRASGVVVSRPAVIVSAPPKVVGKQPGRPARARQAREDSSENNLFGQGLISEKSLDEVILAYLSDDASEE